MADSNLRVQLHSSLGRALFASWIAVATTLGCWLGLRFGTNSPPASLLASASAHLLLILVLRPFARRGATPVYARPGGVEIGKSHGVIPWSNVAELEDLRWIGGALVRLQRLSFRDDTPSLVFYARDEARQLVRDAKRRADAGAHQNPGPVAQHGLA